MRSFKKSVLSLISFFLCLILLISAVIFPFFLSGSYGNDVDARKQLKGKMNFIVVGASHGLAAFNPAIIDKTLGVCSWNLSAASASFYGRRQLLENELKRNEGNIETVVLEISYDSMSISQKERNGVGEPLVLPKLENTAQRIQYLGKYVSFVNRDYENLTAMLLRYGLKAWRDMLTGKFGEVQQNKGFVPNGVSDVRLSDDNVFKQFNSDTKYYDFIDEDIDVVTDIISMCREFNAEPIIVVTPISDAAVWEIEQLDAFYSEITEFCTERNVCLLDFNLLKSRYDIFSDEYSYTDITHLSERGAEDFSAAFSEIMLDVKKGVDVSGQFYSLYSQIKDISPYMSVYNS